MAIIIIPVEIDIAGYNHFRCSLLILSVLIHLLYSRSYMPFCFSLPIVTSIRLSSWGSFPAKQNS